MCGINGFTYRDESRIRMMNEKTKHRGPDGNGVFVDDHISLGHNRLSILDLAERASQPMTSSDGRYVIVYNGEVYNFKELRDELMARGVTFVTSGDTEVVLAYFAHFGVAGLTKLRGIFSFAIYDKQEATTYVVRDRRGVKPLFYTIYQGKFIFSSDARALFVHDIPKKVSIHALNLFFRLQYVLSPHTMWEGVMSLPAGQVGIIRDGGISFENYVVEENGPLITDYAEAQRQVKEIVTNATVSQLVSDRPLGIFLSGGIDSSVLASILAKQSTKPTHSFSVGFVSDIEQDKYNIDATLARKTAEHFGFTHHELLMTGSDAVSYFEEVVRMMDVPVSNHIEVATWMLAREATKDVKVVLGGDGGDEVFLGYDRYYYYHLFDQIKPYRQVLNRAPFRNIFELVQKKYPSLAKLSSPNQLSLFMSMMAQKEELVASLLPHEVNSSFATLSSYARFFTGDYDDTARLCADVDMQTWLIDESLMRSDKLTMAHGLEQRVPFLDDSVVALARRLPTSFLLDTKTVGKKILRDAFHADLLPEVARAKKRGFFSPSAKWLRSDMKEFAYTVLSPDYCESTKHLFEWENVRTLLDDHVAIRRYGLTPLWSLLTFQVWAKHNL